MKLNYKILPADLAVGDAVETMITGVAGKFSATVTGLDRHGWPLLTVTSPGTGWDGWELKNGDYIITGRWENQTEAQG